jgi:hypothetical protein
MPSLPSTEVDGLRDGVGDGSLEPWSEGGDLLAVSSQTFKFAEPPNSTTRFDTRRSGPWVSGPKRQEEGRG